MTEKGRKRSTRRGAARERWFESAVEREMGGKRTKREKDRKSASRTRNRDTHGPVDGLISDFNLT